MLNRVVMSIFAHSAALKFLRYRGPNPVGIPKSKHHLCNIAFVRAFLGLSNSIEEQY